MLTLIKNHIGKVITGVVVIFSIFGGVWAFEDRYVSRADNIKDMVVLEEKLAGALQKQETKSDYKFYQFLYDKAIQDMKNIKRLLRRDPEDKDLKEDYQDLKKQKEDAKKKLNEIMEKMG